MTNSGRLKDSLRHTPGVRPGAVGWYRDWAWGGEMFLPSNGEMNGHVCDDLGMTRNHPKLSLFIYILRCFL